VILSAIQTFDGSFKAPIAPIYETLKQLGNEFNSLYPINKNRVGKHDETLGVALGRYPQDIYNGSGFGEGNPWFLATLASAELMCKMVSARAYPQLRNELLLAAKRQFNRVTFHLDASGRMREQFSRHSGYQLGARDLTWSYASFITAYRACAGVDKTL
jgi:glucoamylase